MRRIIGGILFAVMLTQSSGASALAASDTRGDLFTSIGGMLVAAVTPLHDVWLNSGLHAMFSGQMSRWEAMHAPRPVFPRVRRIARPPDARRSRNARMERRYGRSVAVPGLHRPEAIDPRKAPRDPMALRRSGMRAPMRLAFTPRWNARGRFSTSAVPMVVNTATPSPAGARVAPMYCGPHGCSGHRQKAFASDGSITPWRWLHGGNPVVQSILTYASADMLIEMPYRAPPHSLEAASWNDLKKAQSRMHVTIDPISTAVTFAIGTSFLMLIERRFPRRIALVQNALGFGGCLMLLAPFLLNQVWPVSQALASTIVGCCFGLVGAAGFSVWILPWFRHANK